jgi:lipopolysaccharide transport system permease protein
VFVIKNLYLIYSALLKDVLVIMLRKFLPFIHDLWKHRELLWQFTVRNVELRHKGSHLGLLWSILNPLLMLGLYVFVFGEIFNGKFGILAYETKWDYAMGVFLGLIVFHLLAEVMGIAPTTIVANPNFVKKVVFPLEIIPAANVGASIFHMLISVVLLVISMLVLGSKIGWEIMWLPVILFPVVLLCLGLGWALAALGVFFRDINQIMPFLSMALMFGSAVFYPVHQIPAAAWVVMRFNPLLVAIDLARKAALWHQPIDYQQLGFIYLIGIAACVVGHWVFRKTKPAFADVL